MADLLSFLEQHAGWLFGSGGLAAVCLAVIKLKKPGVVKPGARDTNQEMRNITAGGHVAGGNVQIKNGIGALEIGIMASAIVCIVGLLLLVMPSGNSNQASNGSAVIEGNVNTTTINTGQ